MIHRMRYIRFINLLFLLCVLVSGAMAQADFTASETFGCTPLNVKFSIEEATVDMDSITSIDWYFGFGDTITSVDPDTITYENEGVYSVTMIINGDVSSPIIKTDYITVHRTVSATFRYEEYASNFNYRFIPLDEITDPSATYFYMWRYLKSTGTDNRANDYIVTMTDQELAIDSVTLDTGTYTVRLRVEDTYGCASSSEMVVQVTTEIQIPNVFVPEVEKFYIIDPADIGTVLKFEVFNRYGLLIFSQVAPIINWNGKTNNGQDLRTGVYYYLLQSVEGDTNSRYDQAGFIHLYR